MSDVQTITVYLTVDKNGTETVHNAIPEKDDIEWSTPNVWDSSIILPKGTIEKILGYKLTWEDDYVKLSGPLI